MKGQFGVREYSTMVVFLLDLYPGTAEPLAAQQSNKANGIYPSENVILRGWQACCFPLFPVPVDGYLYSTDISLVSINSFKDFLSKCAWLNTSRNIPLKSEDWKFLTLTAVDKTTNSTCRGRWCDVIESPNNSCYMDLEMRSFCQQIKSLPQEKNT